MEIKIKKEREIGLKWDASHSVVMVKIRMEQVIVSGFFFFKQKTAYEIPLCDWSSDVCSSDRSEEHTSELQSHSGISYAVFCLEFRRVLFLRHRLVFFFFFSFLPFFPYFSYRLLSSVVHIFIRSFLYSSFFSLSYY